MLIGRTCICQIYYSLYILSYNYMCIISILASFWCNASISFCIPRLYCSRNNDSTLLVIKPTGTECEFFG